MPVFRVSVKIKETYAVHFCIRKLMFTTSSVVSGVVARKGRGN